MLVKKLNNPQECGFLLSKSAQSVRRLSRCYAKVKFQESAKFRGCLQRDSALLAKEPIEHRLRHVGFLCDPVFGQAAGCNRLPQVVDDRLRIPLTVLWFHGRPSLVTIPFRVRCSAISRKVWPAFRRLLIAAIASCSSLFGTRLTPSSARSKPNRTLPQRSPLRILCCNASLVRSPMVSRSHWATVIKTFRTSRPAAVRVSMESQTLNNCLPARSPK